MENDQDHSPCDINQQLLSTSHQQVPVTLTNTNEESTLQLVSPQPVITTITKQAEISPTDKFVSTRKVNLNVNQVPYNISTLSDHNLQRGVDPISGDVTQNDSHPQQHANMSATHVVSSHPTDAVSPEQVGERSFL